MSARRPPSRRRVKWLVTVAALTAFAIALVVFVETGATDSDVPASLGSTAPPSSGLVPQPIPIGSTSGPPGSALTRLKPGSVITGPGGGKITVPPLPNGPGSADATHTLTVSVTSRVPLPAVGYLIPTSYDHPYGIVKSLPKTFSLTTVVYGKPYYSAIFIRADSGGVPVTCSIAIDGKRTTQAATSGPYGRQGCVS